MERAGLAVPKPQSSEHMAVAGSEFVLISSRKEILLSIEVEVSNRPVTGRFLRVIFPEGVGEAAQETKVVSLGADSTYRVRSSSLAGLKYLHAYPVQVQLSEDQAGEKVIETLTQYVRFEVPPAALARLGVEL